MSFADSDSFTSSFIIWISFVSFSCLIVVAICWIEKARRGIFVFFLILRVNPLSFSPLSIMLAVDLSCMDLCWCYVPSILTLFRVFIMNRCWILSKGFFASVEVYMIFILQTFFGFCFVLFYFLGLHLWHMDVPRLEVESLPQLTATPQPTEGGWGSNLHLHGY